VTVTLEALLAGFGSLWLPGTIPVLVMVPVRVGISLIPTKALRPLPNVPRPQLTFPAAWEQEPWLADEKL
jgi:hypothetical protein